MLNSNINSNMEQLISTFFNIIFSYKYFSIILKNCSAIF